MKFNHLPQHALQPEIFLHVCSFLDASTIVHSLSLVCKQFRLNLKDDLLWKKRFNRICPDASHPLLRPARPDKLFRMLSCVAIEKQTALWQQQNSMQKVTIEKPHSDVTNCVLLTHINGNTYIVSATDFTLRCHKLSSCEEQLSSYEVSTSHNEHFPPRTNCLATIDHTIYGCASYYRIKSWVLTNTGLVHRGTYEIGSWNGPQNHLCGIASCPEEALFATSLFSGTICVFDSRASNKPVVRYRPYTTLIPSDYSNRTCVSMRRDWNWVCIGDREAKLHMLDPKNDFELVKSYSTEHTGRITKVRLTHGCLITSSNSTVRISTPTDPPKPIATLHTDFIHDCSMDYLSDTLAISNSDGSIAVWRPK